MSDTDRHDPDPRDVLDRLIQRLPPDDRHRAREAVEALVRERNGYLQEAAEWQSAWVSVSGELHKAMRGDVTAEMASEVTAEQVRAYLEGAQGWTFCDEVADPYWRHDNTHRTIWAGDDTIRHDLATIAHCEGRGEIDCWLDIRAQEVE